MHDASWPTLTWCWLVRLLRMRGATCTQNGLPMWEEEKSERWSRSGSRCGSSCLVCAQTSGHAAGPNAPCAIEREARNAGEIAARQTPLHVLLYKLSQDDAPELLPLCRSVRSGARTKTQQLNRGRMQARTDRVGKHGAALSPCALCPHHIAWPPCHAADLGPLPG